VAGGGELFPPAGEKGIYQKGRRIVHGVSLKDSSERAGGGGGKAFITESQSSIYKRVGMAREARIFY